MKISKYTFVLRKGVCSLIYNCRTDSLSAIDNHLADFVEEGKLLDIEKFYPEFHTFLCNERYIVDETLDECQSLINAWRENEKSPYVSIFLNPTMDCNLRCWYCYEKHERKSKMSKGVTSSVLKLIDAKIEKDKIKTLNVSMFGGEPLLAFEDVVMPFLTSLNEKSIAHNLAVHVGFVTNGVLMTEKNVRLLKTLPVCSDVAFQVTLDGYGQVHDNTKHFATGEGTYSIVLNNLKNALHLGVLVTLRLNTTRDNLASFLDVLSDLEIIPKHDLKYLEVDIQHVWQDKVPNDFKYISKMQSLRDKFVNCGIKVRGLKHIDNSRCYADRQNHYTINYDGNVYKCTARQFSSGNNDGILKNTGEVIWNERHEKREKLKYGNDYCHECNIFPICHGGCSQFKMETDSIGKCLRGYTDSDMEKIVGDRVDYIINHLK